MSATYHVKFQKNKFKKLKKKKKKIYKKERYFPFHSRFFH